MYKKLKHKYDGSEVVRTDMIYRKADETYIPFDPLNTDYKLYLEWLKIDGNEPDPAD